MSHIIRVMIVDDHDIVRNGLKMLLQTSENLALVGEATNGEQAVAVYESIKPDVVLMDLVMPGMDGVEATRRIREIDADSRVIVLTSFHEPEQIHAALRAGATSYLMKNISIDDLGAAIEAAYIGKSILAQEALQVLLGSVQYPPMTDVELTEREREVLAYIVEGMNNREIADKMYLSQSTVKKHISTLFTKLNVTNRVEAVTLAIQRKLVNV
jgi:two-component system, NarL family, response regulator LiaR